MRTEVHKETGDVLSPYEAALELSGLYTGDKMKAAQYLKTNADLITPYALRIIRRENVPSPDQARRIIAACFPLIQQRIRKGEIRDIVSTDIIEAAFISTLSLEGLSAYQELENMSVNGKIQASVGVTIMTPGAEKVLCVKRKDTGKLSNPAGHVENERFIAALRRELWEEVGIDLTLIGNLFLSDVFCRQKPENHSCYLVFGGCMEEQELPIVPLDQDFSEPPAFIPTTTVTDMFINDKSPEIPSIVMAREFTGVYSGTIDERLSRVVRIIKGQDIILPQPPADDTLPLII